MRGNNNYTLYVIPVTLYIPLLESPVAVLEMYVFIAREVIAVDQLHRHYSIPTLCILLFAVTEKCKKPR